MMHSAQRRDAITAILSLVPPRQADWIAARENLERLDDAALEKMRVDLVSAAQAVDAERRPVAAPPEAGGEKRARGRGKLIEGFTKLAEATRRLEAHDRARARRSEQTATATAGSREEGARGTRGAPPVPDRTIVPVGPSGVAVGKMQAIISAQIASVFEHSRTDAADIAQIAGLFEALTKDKVIETYLRVHLTGMVRDVLALSLEGRLSGADPGLAPILQRLQAHVRAPSPAVETTFLSDLPPVPGSPVLGATTAIDGFAKMVVRMRGLDPDYVVVMDGSGQIAGDLVEHTAESRARFVVMDRTAERLPLDDGLAARARSVLILDDVARTGLTMRRSIERCRAEFRHASVQGMALVGTVESAAVLGDEAFFPTISPDAAVSVPWNKTGAYRETDTDYVLGWGKPDSLSINKVLLDHAIRRLASYGRA